MSELRQDPITGRWTIFAATRAQRPQDFRAASYVRSAHACPFCEGSERLTPHEILAHRPAHTDADEPGWRVRVVPNKYPALSHDQAESDHGLQTDGELPAGFCRRPALGVHEVIIESPRHVIRTSELSVDEFAEVLDVCRERLNALRQNRHIAYATFFKNVGPQAGATIEHAHSQLVGLPIVPPDVQRVGDCAKTFYDRHQQCVFCHMMAREFEAGDRIVARTARFVAFCPFAARCAYETWLAPVTHENHFGQLDDAGLREAAGLLQDVLGRIDDLLDRPAYNLTLQSAPFDTEADANYHWHIAVIPRLATLAGFEWGTGCYINSVAPESAAQQLQLAKI